jgi:hypothetical protein
VRYYTKIPHKHVYRFCMKHFLHVLKITNMALERNFEVVFGRKTNCIDQNSVLKFVIDAYISKITVHVFHCLCNYIISYLMVLRLGGLARG